MLSSVFYFVKCVNKTPFHETRHLAKYVHLSDRLLNHIDSFSNQN